MRRPARKIAITMNTNVVNGKSVPGAFPPPPVPPPPPDERFDNPATAAPAAAFFSALPVPPVVVLLPVPLPALPPDAVDGETEAEPELPPPLPPPEPPPEPALWCPVGFTSGMYCSTAACPKELDAATSIPAVARTSAGKITLLKAFDAPVDIAAILAISLGPEGSS